MFHLRVGLLGVLRVTVTDECEVFLVPVIVLDHHARDSPVLLGLLPESLFDTGDILVFSLPREVLQVDVGLVPFPLVEGHEIGDFHTVSLDWKSLSREFGETLLFGFLVSEGEVAVVEGLSILQLGHFDTEDRPELGEGFFDLEGREAAYSLQVDVTVHPVEVASEDTHSDPVVQDHLVVHFLFGQFHLLCLVEEQDPVVPVLVLRSVPLLLGLLHHCLKSPVLAEILQQDLLIAVLVQVSHE